MCSIKSSTGVNVTLS